jgi:hypothetical protein
MNRIQELPAEGAIPLIQQRIISRALFDSRRGNCGIDVMIRSSSLRGGECRYFRILTARSEYF